ncbi:MAG: sensor histidine kinase [Gammaproteobacteria bacterium]|jgi:PAS domain S-box-containing protein|nr:sensor histidine kinase [Gammaproteobacteria bacterium]
MNDLEQELKQLREELAYYKNLLAIMPGHIYWLDRNNVYLGSNHAHAKAAGLKSVDDWIGTTPYDHASKYYADAVCEVNNRIMETGNPELLEEIGEFSSTGIKRTYLSHKIPIQDRYHKVIGLLGFSVDITEKKQLEQDLLAAHEESKKTSEMLSNIIDIIPGHVYWLDRDNVIRGCNQQIINTMGLQNKSQLINSSLYQHFPKHDADAVVAINNRIMSTGKAEMIEEVGYYQGQAHNFLSKKTPMYNQEGDIVGILGVSIDITAEKRLSQELHITQERVKETENTLDNLISLLPALVYWKDRNGVYLGANTIEAIAAGYKDPKELIGKTDYDIAWKSYAEALIQNDNQIMQLDETQTFEEVSIFAKDGVERIFLSNKAPLKDVNGQIIGTMGVSFDITERKHLEQELYLAKQRAESALEHIIAIMPGHVYWEDKQGLILGCNDILAQALGLKSRFELIGKTIYDYLPASEAAHQRTINQQVIETGKPYNMEKRFVNPDGSKHVLLSQKTPLRDNSGHIFGLLDTAVDITERKQVEQALQDAKEKAESANLAKTDFIASMSHDFRTPLNGIIGLAEILLLRLQQPEYKELIQNILDCGKTIANLIENILNYAQIEAGRYELQNKPFDLRELIEHIITIIAPQAQQKGIELMVVYQPQLPHLFYNDPLAINRILINLIGNALKFTEAGHILIRVIAEEITKEQANISIIVEDTGIGIPSDKITKIFERFTRSEPSYISKYKGSGLGLAIVEKLVTSLKGSIAVTSEEGKGSRFVITLPLALQSPVKPKSLATKEILIIDNNLLRAQLLAEQLMPNSYSVYSVKAAIENLAVNQKNNPYQVVIIDIQALGHEPFELLTQLKTAFKQQKPIMIIAAETCSLEDREHYKVLGIDKILIKPLRPSELNRVLEDTI